MAESGVAPYLLTPLDNAMPRKHVPKFLFFPEPGNMSTAIDTFRHGFAKLLEDVPLFSGTIQATGQKGGLCVTAPWNTVEELFHVKDLGNESGFDYQDLRSKHFPLECLGNKAAFLPMAGIMRSERPVMLVQLNIIRGGIIMAFCVHHSFTDGIGTFAITRAWAAHCRGENGAQSVTKEMLDRERLMQGWGSASLADIGVFSMMPHQQQAASNGILSYISTFVVEVDQAVFFFSKSKLAELKSMASVRKNDENRDVWISTNDALCALLGCCILSAGDPQIVAMSNRIRSIALVVGMRHALNPPLPKDYIGNVMIFVGLHVPTRSMYATPDTVSGVAYELRDQMKQHKEPYLRKVIAALSSVEDLSRVTVTPPSAKEDVIAFSSWANQKYYELDWGNTIGSRIERLRLPVHLGLCLILPDVPTPNSKEDEGGMEASFCLKREDMKRLKQSELFMRFAQWRCN
ncbi:transferase family-domain-containing protein [Usnea florida]